MADQFVGFRSPVMVALQRDSGPKSDLCNFEIWLKHSENGSDWHDEEVWGGPQEWQMLVLPSVHAFNTVSHPLGAQLN